jgi:hypothetical protein
MADWHSIVIGALSFASWCLLVRAAVALFSIDQRPSPESEAGQGI